MELDNDYSQEAFYNFIDYTSKKGLIKSSTAGNWRSAAKILFSVLENEHAKDLRNISVDDICTRYANLRKASPQSLQMYRSRLKGALEDFFEYAKDRVNYRPQITQRTRTRKTTEINPTRKILNKERELSTDNRAEIVNNTKQKEEIIFPIPIRQNHIVKICNMPHDLNDAEAERICAVIKALAIHQKI